MKQLLQSLLIQIQFFTRIPIPFAVPYSERLFIRGLLWYPLIAMLFGAIMGSVLLSFRQWGLEPLGISLVCILSIAIYGILHLDGLADTADGFFSGKDRDRTLEIMRDSRIGTNGAVALVLYFVVKVSLLLSIKNPLAALALSALGARFSMIVLAGIGTYARSDSGLGSGVITQTGKGMALLSGLLAALVAIAIFPAHWKFILILLAVASLVAFAMNRFSTKKIGGITGDVLGAHVEVAEIVLLFSWVCCEIGGLV